MDSVFFYAINYEDRAMCESYNGWRNRETWLVNLWFSDQWETAADVQATREYIEEFIDCLPYWVKDFIYSDRIDWEELKGHVDAIL